jgi:predicted amidohydrolase YtcJ
VAAAPLHAQDPRAIVGGTLIDGTNASPVADAVVLVRGGLIECAGSRAHCHVPAGVQRLDARGKWVIPGLIDAHVHFSQTGWFDGRPDASISARNFHIQGLSRT